MKRRKRNKKQQYFKIYYQEHKLEQRERDKKTYRRHHITVTEKKECYATGNYEEAIEKLKIEKGIKDVSIRKSTKNGKQNK